MTSTIDDSLAHHQAHRDAVVARLVSSIDGLSSDEVRRRLAEHGPNALDAEARMPAWKKFVLQFKDFLILILLGAAAVSFAVSGELKTPLVVL
ncbi:MAG: hypothetical protein EBX99_13750, partial [Acidimicrobiia bacterium]|nr:hypothetical protein [Acidimicrobiia bacterium]